MTETVRGKRTVAVVGAGPAGLYGAQQLVKQGAQVVLLNRDIKPGGLAEYGIYPEKYKMKEGLRAQFEKILALPEVEYYGNVTVGANGTLALDGLFALGFDAVLVTVGAQGTKSLGLPGENLCGVYHAKDLVYHYNQLPPFSQKHFEIGKRAIIVGVGNVMMDVARWLIRDRRIETVTAVARRGPAEIKFDKKEFEVVGANVDLDALDAEIARCAPVMQAIGQNPQAARAEILAGLPRALPPISATRFLFDFLASPKELCGDNNGRVVGMEVEENTLLRTNGDTKAKGLGAFREIACDTVIFAIGDQVDAHLGLPMQCGEYAINPTPQFPIDGNSYEAYDPQAPKGLRGLFVAGWARQPSVGLVGTARKDGTNAALAVVEYLKTLPPPRSFDADALQARLQASGEPFVTNADLRRLEKRENAEASRRGLPEFKFPTNQEMLEAMGLE